MPESPREDRWKRLPTLERVPRIWGDPGPLVRLLADHDGQRTPPVRPIGNLTAKQFLQLLQQSGLVEDTAISPRLREWDAELAPTGGLAATTGLEVARRLVASRLLSVWQAEKLLSGKHKGYYLANYRIIDLLGITPWSAVYRAEHQLMRRAAVMEVLSDKLAAREDQRERFFRRARSVAELDHPNLVHMFDMGEERGMCYTVMEYVAGYNVRRLVRRLGPLPQDMAVGIVRQAGLGLQAVQTAGKSLGDLPPQTVLLDPNGVVHLLTLRLDTVLAEPPAERAPTTPASSEGEQPDVATRSSTAFPTPSPNQSLGFLLAFLLLGPPSESEGKSETPEGKLEGKPEGNLSGSREGKSAVSGEANELAGGVHDAEESLAQRVARERPAVDEKLLEILRELISDEGRDEPGPAIRDGVARLTEWLAETGG